MQRFAIVEFNVNGTRSNKEGRDRARQSRTKVTPHLTDKESALIQTKIDQSGLTKNEAIRLLLLHEVLPQKVFGGLDPSTDQAYRNLQSPQSNLNQIAKHFNQHRGTGQISEKDIKIIYQHIVTVEKLVKELRTDLLTGGEQTAERATKQATL